MGGILGLALLIFSGWSYALSPAQHEAEFGQHPVVGILYPKQLFLLSMETSGIVEQIYVEEGDYVKVGERLIRLSQEVEQNELNRIRVLQNDQRLIKAVTERLSVQQQQLDSALQLYEMNRSISLDELNTLRMNLLATQAELIRLELSKFEEKSHYEAVKIQLAQRTLVSPFSGYITRVSLKKGEWASAGEPIVELVDISQNYIRINLSHQQANRLELDQLLNVQIEAHSIQGRVQFISPVADPAGGLVEVKVAVDNPNTIFRPGLKATVFLEKTHER
jgi:RND family efflux transporter MFP subunit